MISIGNSVYLDTCIPSYARLWRNRREIRKWCRQYTLISVPEQVAWLERTAVDPSIRMFGVYVTPGGLITVGYPIGVCGLTSINHVNQSAEFSLYIAEDQKKGYGRDALKTLLHHGFNDLNLNRIWGEVFDENPAMKMFEEVGFTREGTLRQSYFREGKFIDSHIISLLRGETCF